MWLGLLGPLLVRGDGPELPVLPGKQRAVLAALALLPGQVVSLEELSRVLWDDMPPPRAAVTVRNYAMRLRRRLGPAAGGRVITRAPGYLLEADGPEVDVLVFEDLCRAGNGAAQAGQWQRTADLLADALSLWRGSALADVPSEALHRERVPQLEQLRLQAVECWMEAQLKLGRHSDLIPELQSLVTRHPLRETFHGQFMTALYRAGRQSEALAEYRRARDLLVAELGVEPGERLRQLHQRILASDPALLEVTGPAAEGHARAARQGAGRPGSLMPLRQSSRAVRHENRSRVQRRRPAVPRQLPAVAPHFTGRDAEMVDLDSLLDAAAHDGAAVAIAAVSGMAGVGKTALAVRWAHRVAGKFPGGQLYTNLRGYGPPGEPMEPTAAIRGFLQALGVAADRIPVDPLAQAGLYRSLLARRRILLVLDNARDEDQLRPLLPGPGSSLVVVTSRTRLTGLAATEGARMVSLDVLSDTEARRMLASRLRDDRVAGEPDAVEELIGLCGRLPLALAIAAARAADRPGFPLARLAAELAERKQLPALDAGDATTSVRAVFGWSYQQLDAPTARMFRLLGLHPGPDIPESAAARLADVPVRQAQDLLRLLARGCLLTESSPGRFVFHDLLRAYAAEQAEAVDSPAHRAEALTLLFGHYVHATETATRALSLSPVTGAQDSGGPISFADPDAAVAWLDAERANLTAIAANAASSDFTIRLAAALFRYLDHGGHFADARTIHVAALDAARRAGDRAAEANELKNCVADFRQGRCDQASGKLRQALEIYRDLGDQLGEERTLANLGHVLRRQGRYQEAADQHRRAVVLARDLGDTFGEAVALDGLGKELRLQGHYQSATDHHRQAIVLFRELSESRGEGIALENLARVLVRQGLWQKAADCLDQALAALRQEGSRYSDADITNTYGAILAGQGRHRQAFDYHGQALALYRGLGDRYGEASALNGIGEAFAGLGIPARAASHHWEALTIAAGTSDRYQQARAHCGLANASAAVNDTIEARRHWQHAFDLYFDLGCPEVGQAHSALQSLQADAAAGGHKKLP
jgi:DNA-binding SARP family transcriptional activator/tetratricopeptide (TPR) repeat protein